MAACVSQLLACSYVTADKTVRAANPVLTDDASVRRIDRKSISCAQFGVLLKKPGTLGSSSCIWLSIRWPDEEIFAYRGIVCCLERNRYRADPGKMTMVYRDSVKPTRLHSRLWILTCSSRCFNQPQRRHILAISKSPVAVSIWEDHGND